MRSLKTDPQADTPSYWDEVKPLWVSALALFCVLSAQWLCHKVLHIHGERYEWTLYLTLGSVFPALLIALTVLPERWPAALRLTETFQQALVVFLVLACGCLLFRIGHYYLIPIVLVHWGLTLLVWQQAQQPLSLVRVVLALGVITMTWAIAIRFFWWSEFTLWFPTRTRGASSSSVIYSFMVFGLAFALVFRQVMGRPKPVQAQTSSVSLLPTIASATPLKQWLLFGASGLAITLLLVISFRTDTIFNEVNFYHWAAIAGPAAMLQQGGWLYWDVPAQYGFLSTLTIAALPTHSIWQSLYILNGLLSFGSALFIYCLLRSLRLGFGQCAFALLVALCSVFLMCGYAPSLSGPQAYPAVGAFRFFWCYVLLTVLVLYARCEPVNEASHAIHAASNLKAEQGTPNPMSRQERWLLWAGCGAWLLGTLWSSESAVFCGATWLPAYGLIVLQKAQVGRQTPHLRLSALRFIGGWLALPGLLLVAAVSCINAYYLCSLKHLLDWRGFVEYSLSFSNGFSALPIYMRGAVLTLFLIFCAFSTVAIYFVQQRIPRPLGLIIATWGMLWAVSSYFVSRSHENNATTLTPLYCAAIAIIFCLFHWHRKDEFWTQLVRISFIPILTIIITSTLGNGMSVKDYLHNLRISHKIYETDINGLLPRIDPSLQTLLQMGHATPGDPIVLIRLLSSKQDSTKLDTLGGYLFSAWPVQQQGRTVFFSPPRTWLPTAPLVLFAPLTVDRRQVYMARFAARSQLGGWMIEDRALASYQHFPWFAQQLLRTHQPTKMLQNDHWRMTWFEPKHH